MQHKAGAGGIFDGSAGNGSTDERSAALAQRAKAEAISGLVIWAMVPHIARSCGLLAIAFMTRRPDPNPQASNKVDQSTIVAGSLYGR